MYGCYLCSSEPPVTPRKGGKLHQPVCTIIPALRIYEVHRLEKLCGVDCVLEFSENIWDINIGPFTEEGAFLSRRIVLCFHKIIYEQ